MTLWLRSIHCCLSVCIYRNDWVLIHRDTADSWPLWDESIILINPIWRALYCVATSLPSTTDVWLRHCPVSPAGDTRDTRQHQQLSRGGRWWCCVCVRLSPICVPNRRSRPICVSECGTDSDEMTLNCAITSLSCVQLVTGRLISKVCSGHVCWQVIG